jgi:uncharacterized surface protein with fasciclin (FAS1) repeats
VTHLDRNRRVAALVALASIGLVTACTSASPIDDGSAVAAAAAESDTPISAESSAPTTSPSLPTVHDLLAQDRFVQLGGALQRSGLDTVIDGLDEFVLFAPTDAAFLSSGTDIGIDYSTLMNDVRMLEAIMRYHIVADPSTNRSWRTLNGLSLDVEGSADDTIERVDGVEILDRVPVRGGTVVVVQRILLPTSETGDVSSVAQRND